MSDSGEWRQVRVGNSIVSVRRGSVIDAVYRNRGEQPVVRHMSWSLGTLVDLLWMVIPESRPVLIALIQEELNTADRNDRELYPLSLHEVAQEALWGSLFEPALLEFPDSFSVISRYSEFVRTVYDFEAPDRDLVREVIDEEILRKIVTSSYFWTIEEIDLELHALIVRRFGSYYDTSPTRTPDPKPQH